MNKENKIQTAITSNSHVERRVMQREIKFRAWDKNQNKIKRVLSVEWLDNMYVSYWNEPYYATDSVLLMQYTGLKDKNGKEIYEGDILTANRFWHTQQTEHVFFVVEYDSTVGCFFAIDKDDNQHFLDEISFVIVGNIFENPELVT